MKLKTRYIVALCISLTLSITNANAKVNTDQAAKLGNELTPLGGDRTANANGSISAWDPSLFSGIDKEGEIYIDPFAEDKPLYTINHTNYMDYSEKLSPGQQLMLKKYSDYYLNIYPTRRGISYPDELIQTVSQNAISTELIENGTGLKDFKGVVPFPIPQSALEVIWNHVTRYRGASFVRRTTNIAPLDRDNYTIVTSKESYSRRFALKDFSENKDKSVMFYYTLNTVAPARLSGNVILVHETLNQLKDPRRSWVYNSAQRRVRRAPQIGYDSPNTGAGGIRTVDGVDMYNGSPDRYDWKLEGKQELYVPYNSYKLDSKALKYSDIIRDSHLNSEHTRYELHRVWKVVATLKAGQRHVYSKRVFYVDEDSWQILVIDHYDGRGELWRVAVGHNKHLYDVKAPLFTVELIHDLLSNKFVAVGLSNEEKTKFNFNKKFKYKDFTTGALRRAGR